MSKRARITLVVTMVGLSVVLIGRAWLPHREKITYQGRTLEQWFYGGRTNFYLQKTESEANEAFRAFGTNALPFLLATLEAEGDSAFSFKLYNKTPRQFHSWLRYPISGEDIQTRALSHLKTYESLPESSLEALAKRVPKFSNPRVHIHGLVTYRMIDRHPAEPFIKLCERMLADHDFGVSLEAAMYLAQAGGKSTNAASILLGALDQDARLDDYSTNHAFKFRQPPGSPGVPGMTIVGFGQKEMKRNLRQRIFGAIVQLGPILSEAQRASALRYQTNHATDIGLGRSLQGMERMGDGVKGMSHEVRRAFDQ